MRYFVEFFEMVANPQYHQLQRQLSRLREERDVHEDEIFARPRRNEDIPQEEQDLLDQIDGMPYNIRRTEIIDADGFKVTDNNLLVFIRDDKVDEVIQKNAWNRIQTLGE